jgi:hypothetical protein
MIGELERVPLRDVWKHEALDFTLRAGLLAIGFALGVIKPILARVSTLQAMLLEMRAGDSEEGD